MFCCALAQEEQKLSGLSSIEFNHSIPSILRGRLEPPWIPTTALITTGSQIHQAAEQRFGRNRNSGRRISSQGRTLRLVVAATYTCGGSGGGGSPRWTTR